MWKWSKNMTIICSFGHGRAKFGLSLRLVRNSCSLDSKLVLAWFVSDSSWQAFESDSKSSIRYTTRLVSFWFGGSHCLTVIDFVSAIVRCFTITHVGLVGPENYVSQKHDLNIVVAWEMKKYKPYLIKRRHIKKKFVTKRPKNDHVLASFVHIAHVFSI